jgi:anti-sigma factor ChrR (cupin superfamily)
MMDKTNQPKRNQRASTAAQNPTEQKRPVLNETISATIASHIIGTTPAPEVASRIKDKLMQRVQTHAHTFVFANQGEWKTVMEGVQIKLLHQAGEQKSFLLKMAANTSIPGHAHAQDEESFVIDGSVELEGILCHSGDYHYAQAGSKHQAIRTAQGCTLLIKNI